MRRALPFVLLCGCWAPMAASLNQQPGTATTSLEAPDDKAIYGAPQLSPEAQFEQQKQEAAARQWQERRAREVAQNNDAAQAAEPPRAPPPEDIAGETALASAMLCGDRDIRQEASDDIKQEKKYAKEGGGIVDMKQLHDDQDTLRSVDTHLKEVGLWFANKKAKRLPCAADSVRALFSCMSHMESMGSIAWFVTPGASQCEGRAKEIIDAGLQ